MRRLYLIHGKKINYKEMIEYVGERAEEIGEGSSRADFSVEYKGKFVIIDLGLDSTSMKLYKLDR